LVWRRSATHLIGALGSLSVTSMGNNSSWYLILYELQTHITYTIRTYNSSVYACKGRLPPFHWILFYRRKCVWTAL